MTVTVLAFGIVKEIFGDSKAEIEINDSTVTALKNALEEKYPRLKLLVSYMIAVNDEYAELTQDIQNKDEIAIIPPVSGG